MFQREEQKKKNKEFKKQSQKNEPRKLKYSPERITKKYQKVSK